MECMSDTVVRALLAARLEELFTRQRRLRENRELTTRILATTFDVNERRMRACLDGTLDLEPAELSRMHLVIARRLQSEQGQEAVLTFKWKDLSRHLSGSIFGPRDTWDEALVAQLLPKPREPEQPRRNGDSKAIPRDTTAPLPKARRLAREKSKQPKAPPVSARTSPSTVNGEATRASVAAASADCRNSSSHQESSFIVSPSEPESRSLPCRVAERSTFERCFPTNEQRLELLKRWYANHRSSQLIQFDLGTACFLVSREIGADVSIVLRWLSGVEVIDEKTADGLCRVLTPKT